MQQNERELRKAIKCVLAAPSHENIDAAIAWFWQGLPDGDGAQATRFLIYAIRSLSKRGQPINGASILEYLKKETFMSAPCRTLMAEINSYKKGKNEETNQNNSARTCKAARWH